MLLLPAIIEKRVFETRRRLKAFVYTTAAGAEHQTQMMSARTSTDSCKCDYSSSNISLEWKKTVKQSGGKHKCKFVRSVNYWVASTLEINPVQSREGKLAMAN